jgi:hypothetical protein
MYTFLGTRMPARRAARVIAASIGCSQEPDRMRDEV